MLISNFVQLTLKHEYAIHIYNYFLKYELFYFDLHIVALKNIRTHYLIEKR